MKTGHKMLKILITTFSLSFVFSSPLGEKKDDVCQNGCHKLVDGKINVHLVPHSHDDVGWLNTYDGYYIGTGNFDSIANAGVSYILDSTLEALSDNPDRRYIQVETAFFYKWWEQLDDERRETCKNMINSGQLEMINGGWSMNDEAAAHYHSIIDQFAWGFRYLEETVGKCGRPKIGWQIDPFGHSREHAFINKQLGFDGLVVGRLDYRDKNKRIDEKNLDFIWNTNDNFDEEETKLFTTMFPNFYVYESGFCFDVYCSDPELTDENLQERVGKYREILDKYTNYYKTPNILIPMGHDFSYQKAEKNFRNIDKLIEGFKDDDTYNVIYSTPSCYIQAVKDAVEKNNIELTVKTDDFFPYASDDHAYWTGYFSSRPTSKRSERLGNNILQSVKQLATFAKINGDDQEESINGLRRAMGVFQHHDAITGTEKIKVAEDYMQMLSKAIRETEEPISNIITNLLKKSESETIVLPLTNCLLTNMSVCDESKADRFVVAVQNPLSKTVSHYVRLPVDSENYKITGPDSEDVPFDIFDSIHSFKFVTDNVPASKELVFLAKDLPPLGIKLFYIEMVDDAGDFYHPFEPLVSDDQRSFGDESTNGFTVDGNGKLSTVTINGQQLKIKQDFYYYKGFGSSGGRASGAYVFRPDGTAILINVALASVKFAKGTLVDELHQTFDNEVTQIIRVYKGAGDSYIEFDWLVGDLQVDSEGKEVITRFTVADFQNNGEFYTDSNGRQQMKRVKDKRNDYEYDPTVEPITSNYYPVTSKIVIRDEALKLEVAVLNDRAQGGSSLGNGMLELMVHRRETADDGFGVAEVLNEKEFGLGLYARGQHYLTFGNLDDEVTPAALERDLAQRKLLAPLVLVGDVTRDDLTLENLQAALNFEFEGLSQSLPDNVKILTLEPWIDGYLLRLEHIFEKGEDTTLSQDVTVDLTDLFPTFTITELTPMFLGATHSLETPSSTFWRRVIDIFKWTNNASDLSVTLRPMEIKTFVFKAEKKI